MMISKKTTGWLLWLILICHLAFWITANPLQAEEPAKTLANGNEEKVSAKPQEPEGTEGIAVYYARRYQGRRTHSGERFDHNKLTAAHPSLPYGTRVNVINIANKRSIVVTINDRCRKGNIELIDLTRAAARKLGFLGKGSAKVMIIPLPEE
jgi:rare lipoprotein A